MTSSSSTRPIEELNGSHIPLVKRVVGIPGDRIHLRNGIVYLNGVAQNEPQAAKPTYANYDAYVDDFPLMDGSNHPDVTAAWTAALPGYIHDGDVGRSARANILRWATTAPTVRTAAIGASCPAKILLAVRCLPTGRSPRRNQASREAPLAERAAATLHEFTHFFSDTRWRRTLHRVQ